MASFSFPDFNVPGFPFQNYMQQLAAAFTPPNQQFSNASQYGRFNGVNNNGFGLSPNQFQGLFGFQPGPQLPFQPPYANNGMLGSNQGPGANPGRTPPPGTGIPGSGGAGTGGATNGGSLPIPNFPPFNPGAPSFTPGLPNVVPAGASGTPGLPTPPNNGIPPAGYAPPTSGTQGATPLAPLPASNMANNQLKSATQLGALPQSSFSNGLGGLPLDPNMAMTPASQWFAQQYAKINPQLNYSVDAFNNARNAGRNDLAYMMASQGGQGFRDQIAQQGGMSPDAMNQFINNSFYNQGGATAQYNPANIAALLGFGARNG